MRGVPTAGIPLLALWQAREPRPASRESRGALLQALPCEVSSSAHAGVREATPTVAVSTSPARPRRSSAARSAPEGWQPSSKAHHLERGRGFWRTRRFDPRGWMSRVFMSIDIRVASRPARASPVARTLERALCRCPSLVQIRPLCPESPVSRLTTSGVSGCDASLDERRAEISSRATVLSQGL